MYNSKYNFLYSKYTIRNKKIVFRNIQSKAKKMYSELYNSKYKYVMDYPCQSHATECLA